MPLPTGLPNPSILPLPSNRRRSPDPTMGPWLKRSRERRPPAPLDPAPLIDIPLRSLQHPTAVCLPPILPSAGKLAPSHLPLADRSPSLVSLSPASGDRAGGRNPAWNAMLRFTVQANAAGSLHVLLLEEHPTEDLLRTLASGFPAGVKDDDVAVTRAARSVEALHQVVADGGRRGLAYQAPTRSCCWTTYASTSSTSPVAISVTATSTCSAVKEVKEKLRGMHSISVGVGFSSS